MARVSPEGEIMLTPPSCYNDSTMPKDIQWFTDRIGQTVIRSDKDGHQAEFLITELNVKYLADLADAGFTFTEGKLSKPVVHQGPPESVCIGCEG